MKYVIETTENGCIETLEFADGSKFTRRNERTDFGCKALDNDFNEQLEEICTKEKLLQTQTKSEQ